MPRLKDNPFLSDVRPEAVKRLFGDQVLVKLHKTAKFHGSLMIPEEARRKQNFGTVVKLGEEYAGSLKVGDRVLVQPWSGREWQSVKEEYAIYREEAILARIEG